MTILNELWIFFCRHKVNLLGDFRCICWDFAGFPRVSAPGRWGRWAASVGMPVASCQLPVASCSAGSLLGVCWWDMSRSGGCWVVAGRWSPAWLVAGAAMLSAGSGTGWECCHIIGWVVNGTCPVRLGGMAPGGVASWSWCIGFT